MELQHFSHIHPLVFNEETGNENEKAAKCSGCGDLLLGPSFSCMACGFYLDKTCAEAPSELAHPFHRNHNLNLLEARPNTHCDFCYKNCENLVYRCSCDFDLHIKCALFLYNTAEKRAGELQIAHTDPLIPTEIHSEEELKETECFACWKPLSDSAYLSLDSGFYLHKKCFELPLEINHLCHPQHPLFLQFNSECLPCQICQEIQEKGFVYSCSICNFAIHIACAELPTKLNHLCHRQHPLILQLNPESFHCQICQETKDQGVYCCSNCNFAIHVKCVSPPPSIKGEIHEHPFTLFLRQAPFTCDACGTKGDFVSYICLTCGLIVHEKCISLPRIIRIGRHHHSLSHTFILGQHEFKTWDCKICPGEMNAQHGGYCCKDCNYIVHTNCGKEDSSWYKFYDIEEEDNEQFNKNSAFFVIKKTKVGENVIPTEIKHLSHQHNLVLSDDVKDGKLCDGCMFFISTTFYFCSECNFFLHKSCAESPRKMYLWFYQYQRPYSLNFDSIFFCDLCDSWFNRGFAYKNRTSVCFRCALTSDTPTCGGHKHRLTFYDKYEGQCAGCGEELSSGYACKLCNFVVEYNCLLLPNVIRHKCDEHLLKLTYDDQNVYSEHQYCDICEERRNPDLWFYRCAICDSSFHRKCVMGSHPFLKLGLTYRFRDHPHPLTLIQKVYDYPDKCHSCEQHCVDAALECVENECDYILHWDCVEDKSSLTLEGPN